MSDDYLNSIYNNFDIEKKKTAIIKHSGIPLSEYYKIIDNNTKLVPKEDIAKPKLKRCPNGTIRDKVTKECVSKGPVNNTKLPRCPKGTHRNKITLLCEPKNL